MGDFEQLEGRWCPSTLYQFDLIAATGDQGLSGMGTGPSINDSGTVAFVGDFASGAQGIFTGDGTVGGLVNITPTFSTDPNRVFGNPVEINNSGQVLAMDRYTSPGYTQYILRTWDGNATDSFTVYTRAGTPRGPLDSFDALSAYAGINNNGDIVFSALDTSSASPSWDLQYQTSPSGNGSNVASLPVPQGLRPVVSDSPSLVARVGGTNSTSDPLTGYVALPAGGFPVFGIAGAGNGFDQVGPAPGISPDGSVVAFAGDLTSAGATALGLTPGPGIFARVVVNNSPVYVRIAGVTPGMIQSFDLTQRVATNGSTVVFLATDANGKQGVFTAQINAVNPADPTTADKLQATELTEVTEAGGTITVGTTTYTISGLSLNAPINKSGQLAIWAQTDKGNVILRADPLREPVLIVPGIAGTFPTLNTINSWYLNRGVPPDTLTVDPLANTYTDLIQTFENAGYTLGQDLFVVNYDWRVLPGPIDGTPDGVIDGITAQSINQDISSGHWNYGVDYLGYYLEQAVNQWDQDHPSVPLTSVNVVAHSTGGLVTRVYIQSGAYNQVFDGVHKLPTIDNFVELDVPNLGAAKAWNPLQDDWAGDPAYALVLSKILNNALQKLEANPNVAITNPDGSTYHLSDFMTNGQIDEVKFLNAYVPTIRALLATYPFFNNGSGTLSTVNSQPGVRNDLALDLTAITPDAFTAKIGHLDIVYGNGVPTPVSVTEEKVTSLTQPVAVQLKLSQWDPQVPQLGDTIYLENMVSAGDGTVPLNSELGGFTESDKVSLLGFMNQGDGKNTSGKVDHTGMVSNPDVEEAILEEFGYRIPMSRVSTGHGIDLFGVHNIVALLTDPVQAVVTDANGKRLGYTAASGPLAEIPNSVYYGGANGFGLIVGTPESNLTLTTTGEGAPYTVDVGGESGGIFGGMNSSGTLAKGQSQTTTIAIAPTSSGATPVLVVTASNTSPAAGEEVTFTATVASSASGGPAPTGTVQFQVDGSDLGAAVPVVDGTATTAGVSVTAGSHTVSAVYSGDSTYAGLSKSLTLAASAPPSATVALSAGSSSPIANQPLTFTALVTPPALGDPTPTGTVQFQLDGVNVGAPVALVNGMATSSGIALTAGSHTITAEYSGDESYGQTRRSLTLSAAIPTATVALTASGPITIAGQPVTFIATIGTSPSGADIPTGTVQFKVDGTALGAAVTLVNGAATSASVTLTAGSHAVTAVYSGDSTYAGVNSSLTVTAVAPSSFAVGSLDPTFGSQGVVPLADPQAMAIDPQGRILIPGAYGVGSFDFSQFALWRYTADGQPDRSFGSSGTIQFPGGRQYGVGVAVEPDGKLVGLVSGDSIALVRFYTDGSVDTTFGTNGLLQPPSFTVNGTSATFIAGVVYSTTGVRLATLPDGRILLAGTIAPSASSNFLGYALEMFLPDGQLDTSFNGTGTLVVTASPPIVQGLAISDGSILVMSSAWQGAENIAVSAYRFDGTPVSNFGVNGTVAPTLVGAVEGSDSPTMAVQSDGKVLIGYLNDSVNLNSGTETILRYNADGSTDTAFGSGGTTSAGSNLSSSSNIAVEPDGKILIAVGSQLALLRVNPDGSLDTSFGTGGLDTIVFPSNPNANFSQIAVQPSGRIVALTHNNGMGAFGPHNDLFLVGVIGDPVVGFGGETKVSSNSGKPTAEYDVMETAGLATITLVRDGDLSQPLSVPFSTDDSGDRGGVNYTPVNTTVTFTAGSANATVTIPILNDPNASAAVDIPLRLGTPSGGAVLGVVSVGDLHIVPVEGITVAPSQLSSVMPGGPTSSFTVVLTSVPTANVTVPLAISNTNPSAILSTNALVFTPANALVPQTITVTATGGTGTSPAIATVTAGPATSTDPKYNGLAGGSAKVTVYPSSSSSPGAIEFSAANYTVNEGAGTATITLVRLGGSQGTVSVGFATSDGSSRASGKYTPLSGSISFGPGVTTRQFSIALVNPGPNLEGDQTVDLTLSNPSGGATLGVYSTATLTLRDATQISAGDLDPAFGADGVSILPAGGGISGSTGPSVIALQRDGKIVAAGTAASSSGGSLVSVWRTDALGHLDASFGQQGVAPVPFPNFTQIAGIAIAPDGKIVIAGTASGASTSEFALLRLNTDGTVDTGFGTNGRVTVSLSPGNDTAQALAVEPDGSILVAGSIAQANGSAALGLVHFGPDGSLDIGFGTGGLMTFPAVGSGLSAMLQQPNGQWLLVGGGGAGDLFEGGSATPGFAVRLNADFSIDTTFGTQGIASLNWGEFYNCVTLQPDGKIVIGGSEGPLGGGHGTIGRLNPDGSLDTAFGLQGSVSATFSNSASGFNSVFVQPDGRIVGVGYTASAGGNAGSGNYVVSARYLSDGSVDPSFASGGILQYALSGDANDSPGTAVALPNGDLVVTIQSDGLPMLAAELPEAPPSAPVPGEHPGQLTFATSAATVNSGTTATVTVDRFGGADGTVSVAYTLQGNTAVAGTDYTAASGTLTFGPGVTWQFLPVPTLADASATGNLSLDVVLSAPTGGASLSASDTFTLTIVPLTQPALSDLAAPSIAYGTVSTTLSGQISAGTSIPSGSVTISVNGVNEDAVIDPSTGAFSAVFATAAVGVAGSPYTITYNFAGDANFAPVSSTTTLTVNQATPTIRWANPADITEGTALGSTQLDATASVPGTFVYSPAAGTLLSAGAGQSLSLTFTPTDSTDYSSVNATATINVDSVTAPGIPNAPVLSSQSDTGVSNTDGLTKDNGSASAPLVFAVSGVSPPNAFVQLYNDTNLANPIALGNPVRAVDGTATVTLSGGAGLPLADGSYAFAASASLAAGGTQSALSTVSATVTIQSSLEITRVLPAVNFLTTLPNNEVVVTFNHWLAGLVPDVADGTGFTSNPYCVMLIPSGPNGAVQLAQTGTFWSATYGADGGDLPLPDILVYHQNTDGTSTITLTPTEPLSTDLYLIEVGNLADQAGNLLTGTDGTAGDSFFASFDYRPTPVNFSPLHVTGVTADNGSVVINNDTIPQPDTIGIRFNKPLDTWTANTGTIGLYYATAPGVFSQVPSVVTYSPTTDTAYLTPEATLSPGIVYVLSVSAGVSDDQQFPQTGVTLGRPYYTTFEVSQPGVGQGAGPLTVRGMTPVDGTLTTAPLGYVSVTFSEPVDLTSLGRYSVMLISQTGGVSPGNSGYADIPLNAKLAFNPNTNQLIIVPTDLVRNDTIYLIALQSIAATNGDALAGTVYGTFLLNSSAMPQVAMHATVNADETAMTPSVPVSAPGATTAVAINQNVSQSVRGGSLSSSSVRPQRVAGGPRISILSPTRSTLPSGPLTLTGRWPSARIPSRSYRSSL